MSVLAFARALSCCALIITATTATPVFAEPQAEAPPPGGSLCIDGMETEPGTDDLQALAIADTVDGGCMVSTEPVSI